MIAALAYGAALVLAVLSARPVEAQASAGAAGRALINAAAVADLVIGQPPVGTAHLVGKPVKRLPWSPAEPVRWTALTLAVLAVLAVGAVVLARRSWRWHALALRAPPISALA